MGDRGGKPEQESGVENNLSGNVNGPVGQFGTVHGSVHMHWSGRTPDPDKLARRMAKAFRKEAEAREAAEAEEAHQAELAELEARASTRMRCAGLCLVLAFASCLTFGFLAGHWAAPVVLSIVGAIVLFRWIAPAAYLEDEEPEPEVGEETSDAWETYETWEYSESWEVWEED
ncbi:hypothetical protein OIE73_18355 [Streptomyces hirsutus]|uniref:DUF3040 domain-containing protein n=1 Tax=Streptomyces hirsutus TaxID=35620 RepID=A0ABZ1GNL8_9ACTN|nr:hypothetical protein [Streptomyces hirsutus]WSD07520.1 hypothetical protein OIE73_18355 [Streptomyces hirsutus]